MRGSPRRAGARFWLHALRNCFITVANRDLMLPVSLTKRLVNHARPQDVTEGYAADWTGPWSSFAPPPSASPS